MSLSRSTQKLTTLLSQDKTSSILTSPPANSPPSNDIISIHSTPPTTTNTKPLTNIALHKTTPQYVTKPHTSPCHNEIIDVDLVCTEDSLPNDHVVTSNASASSHLSTLCSLSTFSNNSQFPTLDIRSIFYPRRLLFGSTMDPYVKLLCLTFSAAPVYFASSGASDVLRMLTPTEGLPKFSKCFRNTTAQNCKPNRFYLILLYEAEGLTMGHWTLAAVLKKEHTLSGWYSNYLGFGDTNTSTFEKNQKCFTSPSDTFKWHPCNSTPQTEVECSPRTLLAMHSIASNSTINISPDNYF